MPLDPSSSPAADDRTLVAALRLGDYTAFESIYRSEFAALHRYAASLVSPDDAVDAVQDVFFAVWNNRDSLPIHTLLELRYYLFRAVRNRAYNIKRHSAIQDRYDQYVVGEAESLTVSVSEAEDALLGELSPDLAMRVQQLIAMLPERSREILTLRWYHNLPFDEIAQIMEISYSYAHVLHSRALAMVRARLGLK